MNYNELLTNIRDYSEVSSDVLTDSIINVFITNTENKIQRELDLDAFRKFSTSTLVIDNLLLVYLMILTLKEVYKLLMVTPIELG